MENEIRIPKDCIDRIDRVIDDKRDQYSSRDQFIIQAIERMLAELKSSENSQLKRTENHKDVEG